MNNIDILDITLRRWWEGSKQLRITSDPYQYSMNHRKESDWIDCPAFCSIPFWCREL